MIVTGERGVRVRARLRRRRATGCAMLRRDLDAALLDAAVRPARGSRTACVVRGPLVEQRDRAARGVRGVVRRRARRPGPARPGAARHRRRRPPIAAGPAARAAAASRASAALGDRRVLRRRGRPDVASARCTSAAAAISAIAPRARRARPMSVLSCPRSHRELRGSARRSLRPRDRCATDARGEPASKARAHGDAARRARARWRSMRRARGRARVAPRRRCGRASSIR